MSPPPVVLEPWAGEHISAVAAHACAVRDESRGMFPDDPPDVTFTFNGIDLRTTPESTPESLTQEFLAAFRRLASEQDTPERRAEEERRTARQQHAYDEQVRGLLGIDLKDPRKAVRWLCRYEEVASTRIDCHSRPQIVAAFRAAGYQAGIYCARPGRAEEWRRKGRDHKLRWLVGQGMDGIDLVGAPHQIIHHFAEQLGCLGPARTAHCQEGEP